MDQEEINLFSNLPEDIILVEILSRIPIKSVCTCKCVCKSWLKLLETPEFTRSHLSKSVSTFLVHRGTEGKAMLEISEVEEGDLDEPTTLKRLTELSITKKILHQKKKALWTYMEGSTDGLVFFRTKSPTAQYYYYVCNPVTRECIELPTPPRPLENEAGVVVTYGFGISRSGKYKVVRISRQDRLFACQVYTLGSPTWRSIAITQDLRYFHGRLAKCTFLKGNLHWPVRDLDDAKAARWWVSCFDLETEVFTKFRTPPAATTNAFKRVGLLRGCLCLHESTYEREFVIYLMSCYEKKCWDKECVICTIGPTFSLHELNYAPVKVFLDDDALMAWQERCNWLCYSTATKRIDLISRFFGYCSYYYVEVLLYTPSFVSLGDYETSTSSVIRF